MKSLLDNDVDAPTPPYPMSDVVRRYLQQSRSIPFDGIGASRRERIDARAEELWDYLGDFA
jgi:hypothetical protein